MIYGDHNLFIVFLSFTITVAASFLALNIAGKMYHATGRYRLFWLFSGAIVMGMGIWSMHFIGMLAYQAPGDIGYTGSITFLSMIVSVLAAYLAFRIAMRENPGKWAIITGGFVLGIGISAMHYAGMAAMEINGEIIYQPVLVIVSIAIAIVASSAAMFLFVKFREEHSSAWMKWVAAAVLGIAISGTHYSGMMAADIQMSGLVESPAGEEGNVLLLSGVTITIIVIMLISWGAMYFDRHVLEQMAYHDSITGLPNRNDMHRYFLNGRDDVPAIFLFLDMDQFKTINDTLGHHTGDKMIVEVAKMLKTFRQRDIKLFRIGGDEFLLVMEEADLYRAEAMTKAILERFKQPFIIDDNPIYMTATIGISGEQGEADHETLLRAADTAMYQAKRNGRNQYEIYTEEMGETEIRRMQLEKDLRYALERQELFLVYQPKWHLGGNRLHGFEALIRWEHPQLGLISPMEFIPIAEESTMITSITQWTLDTAAAMAFDLQSKGIYQSIAVNMSAKVFRSQQATEMVNKTLDESGIDAQFLELEITETMMLTNLNEINLELNRIRSMGVRISMDDFGTGYSSIGLLDEIPLDAIKLDRKFTLDVERPTKQAIIQAVLFLGDSLQLEVIAEGVETESDEILLQNIGCDIMQGYYYSRPMLTEDVVNWVREVEKSSRCL
ncbi:putative bifunctional diguanylate cyclase/phosphodiesterase [Salisediminibacterium beveridgei]|uniref:Diguanylate cyclase/phosphodiesterase (GGDEF & EAL domains) with PAS/PAC sensor(S) n=1 Tax=Salisediminibacterium beveridgei TaxID=632773 RepID=A0A1D7QXM6_9BACI|nr:EAL domain-containing protein [Salisediminibacterium beveridgei]AOM83766.1 diguanylate cyclase/phosphodiesterase (GGDEF & EAL domains) with PAS/PAC sensor(s) [Salisediminibacterium beveridgei]